MTAIEAVPTITSLELGNDDPLPKAMGRTGRYDSYRFINGQLVTKYREQVAPTAFQPVLREIDVLRELGIPLAQYAAHRNFLKRLLLAGFDRRQDGEIALNQVMPRGTPWVTSFLFRLAEGPPSGGNVQDWRCRVIPLHDEPQKLYTTPVTHIPLGPGEWSQLESFIAASFARTGSGALISASRNHGTGGRFFAAAFAYSLTYTCNARMVDALNYAGLHVETGALFSGSAMRQVAYVTGACTPR